MKKIKTFNESLLAKAAGNDNKQMKKIKTF